MSDARIIELNVPGLLEFRDMAMRVVMEACKLVGRLDLGQDPANVEPEGHEGELSRWLSDRYEFEDRFTLEFTSAFSEIYNNIPIHAYGGRGDGIIKLRIRIDRDHLVVDITDTGKSFDIDVVPAPDELPVGGMGIHIARSMLDELGYESGPPNRWRLIKYIKEPRPAPPPPGAPATS